jgi:glycosyltransferase involved in cell wall biosynthesis
MSSPDEPRVMQIILNLECGGAQETLCVLAEANAAVGSESLICTLTDGPLRARLEEAGASVEIVRGPSCRFSRIVHYLMELRRLSSQLATLIERRRIQVIQTHLLNFLDLLVIRLRHTPPGPAVVWTFHGPDILPERPGLTLWARRFVCRMMYRAAAVHVDAIVCVSEDIRQMAIDELGCSKSKIRVIANTPSPRKYTSARPRNDILAELGVPLGAGVVLFVGRLMAVKGCEFLIEAAPIVLAGSPDALFLVAGSGPAEAELKALAKRAGVAKQFCFLGTRSDIADVLAASDVFCLPSRQEGLSLALIEAMSAGKAVVASDLAANREVVEHGKTGLLVGPGDIAALAAALVHLLTHPASAQAMGREARAYALSKYRASAQREAYARLYRELLAARIRE